MEVAPSFTEENNDRKLKIAESKNVTEDTRGREDDHGLLECNEPGCSYVFNSFDKLELHKEIGSGPENSQLLKTTVQRNLGKRRWLELPREQQISMWDGH